MLYVTLLRKIPQNLRHGWHNSTDTFTLRFIAFLLTKLPASESTGKQAFSYSEVKTSNAVFSKSSQWQIEQDNRRATIWRTCGQKFGACLDDCDVRRCDDCVGTDSCDEYLLYENVGMIPAHSLDGDVYFDIIKVGSTTRSSCRQLCSETYDLECSGFLYNRRLQTCQLSAYTGEWLPSDSPIYNSSSTDVSTVRLQWGVAAIRQSDLQQLVWTRVLSAKTLCRSEIAFHLLFIHRAPYCHGKSSVCLSACPFICDVEVFFITYTVSGKERV